MIEVYNSYLSNFNISNDITVYRDNNYYYAYVTTTYTGLGGNEALAHQKYLYDHAEVRQSTFTDGAKAILWANDKALERLAIFYARATLWRSASHPLYNRKHYEYNLKVASNHDLHYEEAFGWLIEKGYAEQLHNEEAPVYSLTETGKKWIESYEKETAV